VAAKPPASAIPSESRGDKALSLNFGSGSADLGADSKGDLNKIVDALKKNGDLRIQLIAYAAGSEDQASQARRLSLSRALAVRSYLFDQGVSASRMDVRALGNKVEGGGPADRVDIVMLNK
jgi:outer membrane protein OmpA-like peptidoglycan-associated protein